jgi:hypothetical protein
MWPPDPLPELAEQEENRDVKGDVLLWAWWFDSHRAERSHHPSTTT